MTQGLSVLRSAFCNVLVSVVSFGERENCLSDLALYWVPCFKGDC